MDAILDEPTLATEHDKQEDSLGDPSVQARNVGNAPRRLGIKSRGEEKYRNTVQCFIKVEE